MQVNLLLAKQEQPKRGRGAPVDPRKQELFRNGAALYEKYGSWGKAAMKIVPDEFRENPKLAADRIRQGASKYLSKSTSKTA